MLNDLGIYADCGSRCAKARNERDEARAAFERQHFGRMLALENAQDKVKAREAFDDAYRMARR